MDHNSSNIEGLRLLGIEQQWVNNSVGADMDGLADGDED